MSRREYSLSRKCSHEDCKEYAHWSYATQKELREYSIKHSKWTCLRHSYPNKVLSFDNPKTEEIVTAKKSLNYPELPNLFWFTEDGKGGSGFNSGNGYKIYAKDFPEGTKIKITAEIINPQNNNSNTQ